MQITPNSLALLTVLAWPFMVWFLYLRFDAGRALIWSVLGAYLLLPERVVINLPMMPNFDKHSLPILSAWLVSVFILGRRRSLIPEDSLARLFALAVVVLPVAAAVTNNDPILFTDAPAIPGMRLYDSLALVAYYGLVILPFLMARQELASPKAMRDLLVALSLGALVYSAPVVLEAGIGPKLNIWLYGFFQHDLEQHIRFGGFRPAVFLPHGLWLALFMMLGLGATAWFLREGPAARRPRLLVAVIWLALVLVLCRSFGPLGFAIASLPLIFFAPPRVMIIAASLAAAMVLLYPLLRGLHVIPVETIVDLAKALSGERADSLNFRLVNEDILLARAAERPLFGWGGYGRNLLHDARSGALLTVPDGAWIISIGSSGWLGYLAQFGLLCLPIWRIWRETVHDPARVGAPAAVLALLLAVNLVDLLPNGTLVPLTWVMAGALLGHAEQLAQARRAAALDRMGPRHSRTVI